jgi:ribosomal-protein-alanine N-acetyltransferase
MDAERVEPVESVEPVGTAAQRRSWQLRVAGPEDLDAIMAIEESTFTTDAWSPQAMLSDLERKHCHYLVASRLGTPGLVEGYAGLLAPRGSGDGDIQTIAVAKSARREGLGRMLMQALIAEAAARQATQLFLEVRADNPNAQALYEATGFVPIGIRRGYYQPDDVDGITMKLDLPETTTILAEEP